MGLPAIEIFKEGYPNSNISVLAKRWVAPIFLNNPFVSDVMEYDKEGLHKGLSGRYRLIDSIKQKRFDMAILFQNAFEAALIAFLAGIPKRLGYATDGRSLMLTEPVKRNDPPSTRHQVNYYIRLLKILDLDSTSVTQPRLYTSDMEKEWANRFLLEKGLQSDAPLIGMSPGAAYGPAKMWPWERFSRVADRLSRDGSNILLFGSKGDKECCGLIKDGIMGSCVNLAGMTTLREAIALISRCSVFITNDSGLMHLASALEIPTVAIFGSTAPDLTGPIGESHIVLHKNVDCSPCFKRVCNTNFKCMDEITEEDTINAASKILKGVS